MYHAHLLVVDRGMKYNNPKAYYGDLGHAVPWYCRKFDDDDIPDYISTDRYLRTLCLRQHPEKRTLNVWYHCDS